MKITRTSMISGVTRTFDIDVTEDQIEACRSNWHHEALKHLRHETREFIRSGVIASEWSDLVSKMKFK